MADAPRPGETFGRYDVVREIGRGGMGVVFAAVQRGLQREVALKLLSPILAGGEDHRRRFEREARILARLDSPHIVTVYDAGEVNGTLYIATQLIADGDLAGYVGARGALPAREALAALAQIAEGLQAAHEAGVLHRDIKPSNVLVRRTPRGFHLYLCDLGISQALDSEHTKTAGVAGTLGYLAPERHLGEEATVASDIYAMGCLLWAMVTGSSPYGGVDVHVAMGHLYNPVPQLAARDDDERRVNAIVARAMAKEPGERFASAADLLAAVRGGEVMTPTTAPPTPAPPTAPPTTAPSAPPTAPPTAPPPPGPPPTSPPTAPPTVFPAPATLLPHDSPTRPVSHEPTLHQSRPAARANTPTPVLPTAPPVAPPVAPSRRRWIKPFLAAAMVAVLVGVGLVWVLNRSDATGGTAADPPVEVFDLSTIDPFNPPPVVYADESRFDGPAPAVAGAKEGGTLRLDVDDFGPVTLDPVDDYAQSTRGLLQGLLYRSLTQYVLNPATGGIELVPDLATDLGQPNADYTTWRFTIRDGVRWQDGEPVTAEQVAVGLERTMNPPSDVEGYDIRFSESYFESVEVEGSAVVIHMRRPFPEMPWYGAMPAMSPAHPGLDLANPDEFQATGPYLVEQFEPENSATLVRNPEWDPATDPARHAFPEQIDVTWGTQITAGTLADIKDGAQGVVGIDGWLADHAQAVEQLGDSVLTQSTGCTSVGYPDWRKTGGNTGRGRLVRQAMAAAYDAEGVWHAYADVVGVNRAVAGNLLPPGVDGRVPVNERAFDPGRARLLLEEAGYGPSNPFAIRVGYSAYLPDIVRRALLAGFRAAGFKVQGLAVGDPSEYFDPNSTVNPRLTFRTATYCPEWPHTTFLPGAFGSGSMGEVSGYPTSVIADAEAAAANLPLEDQAEHWSKVEQKIRLQVGGFAIGYYGTYHFASDDVGGMVGDTGSGTLYVKNLYVGAS